MTESEKTPESPADSGDEETEVLRAFEADINAGAFDKAGFHRAVQTKVYPLLASGFLSEQAFAQLVRKWAERSNPFDWSTRTYEHGA